MYQLTMINKTMALLGLSVVLSMGQSVAATTDSTNTNSADMNKNMNSMSSEGTTSTMRNTQETSPVTNGVSQKLTTDTKTAASLNKLLPTIKYMTENLSTAAKKINEATWTADTDIDRNVGTKLQALLNWHHNGVGPVDGYWGKNTRKAMQAFQKANNLTVTDTLNNETWQALTKNQRFHHF